MQVDWSSGPLMAAGRAWTWASRHAGSSDGRGLYCYVWPALMKVGLELAWLANRPTSPVVGRLGKPGPSLETEHGPAF